jgi:aspartate-semialdehyde dehydrogenase
MPDDIPKDLAALTVRNVQNMDDIANDITCFFSAVDLSEKEDTRQLEFTYAQAGYAVVSNSSANRWTEDVPMIIPEINPHHTEVIKIQQENRNLPASGFVAVKPNCSIQSYLVALKALADAGYPVNKVQVTTLQALSGAGYAGLSNPHWQKNVIPNISGEELKTEQEPLKILGTVTPSGISNFEDLTISALCTRVPVVDGHTAVVHASFENNIPDLDTIKKIWTEFRADPQALSLPFAPQEPIIYLDEGDRPQPKLDRDSDKGMAVTIGRLENDTFFDIRFVGLSHNTVRGAAGGAILFAELLVKKGYINGT